MGKKTYEELLKIAESRLEEMDEQMQMLDPSDLGGGRKGRAAYDEIFRVLNGAKFRDKRGKAFPPPVWQSLRELSAVFFRPLFIQLADGLV